MNTERDADPGRVGSAEVVVVGAGPTGLMAAYELALAGAEVVVLERRSERLEQVKGGTVQARTAEVLEQRGLLQPIVDRAVPRKPVGGHFGGLPVPLDCGPWVTRWPHPISVPQWVVEEELEHAATRLGARVVRGAEVSAVESHVEGVRVAVGDVSVDARYLVACDGGHSVVRKLLELPFPGRPATFTAVLADVRLAAVTDVVPTSIGHISDLILEGDRYWGMLAPVGSGVYRLTFGRKDSSTEDRQAPVGTEEVRAALTALYGPGCTLDRVLNASRFGDATRQLGSYLHGRVLFAGDAAHVHPPFGGQGLNLGILDAVNLGWKLAAEVAGWAPDGLLDSYQTERHPVAERVIHHTAAQRVFFMPGTTADVAALRDVFAQLMRCPDANRYLAGMMSGLDVEGRIPDLDLISDAGSSRLSTLLHSGRGLLVDLGDAPTRVDGWADRVDRVSVRLDGTSRGGEGASAYLVRPDGIVCWHGDGPVEKALERWFGAARQPSGDRRN